MKRLMQFLLIILAIIFIPAAITARIFDEFEQRSTYWKPGSKGFITVTNFDSDALPPKTLLAEVYPQNPHLIRFGVPFDLAPEFDEILATQIEKEESISVMLPQSTREIFILLAADFPDKEQFAGGGERLFKLTTLDEPERVEFEVVYSDGTSDSFIPLNVRKPSYGIENGLGLYVIHPRQGKKPITLTLHDKMRNAAFGIWALTVNTKTPVVEEPIFPKVWYEKKKSKPSTITIGFNSSRGLGWEKVESAVWGGKIVFSNSPLFLLEIKMPGTSNITELPSTMWKVIGVENSSNNFTAMLSFATNNLKFNAVFTAQKVKQDEVLISLNLKNIAESPVIGKLFFPIINGITFKNWDDTWYFASRLGGIINKVQAQFRDRIGELHPMQVDGFFSIENGGGICFMPQDLNETFRWYNIGKNDNGCYYSLEYIEQIVEPNSAINCAPVLISAVPGDWKEQLAKYIDWKNSWYRRYSQRPKWFREVFSFVCCHPIGNLNFIDELNDAYDKFGACDYAHLFGWAITEKYGHWGDYSHFFQFGKDDEDGKKNFTELIRRVQKSGLPIGLYLDGYLVSPTSINPAGYEREQWGIRNRNGSLEKYYVDCLSMCPYAKGWQDYIVDVYKKLAAEIAPDGLYVDEFGRNLENRICYATNHNHAIPAGMAPGEGILLKRIREAISSNIVLYTEFTPSDVASQYVDGSFSYLYPTAYLGNEDWWLNRMDKEMRSERIAPHYVNLFRFAFPDFKIFQIVYDVPHKNGNWFLLKYPFFNGEGYYLKGEARTDCDARATAFYRKVFAIQHQYADAFTSQDVEPLVKTEYPHLFANRFSAPNYTVWTLYNANYKTIAGKLLRVKHLNGRKYYDVWNNRPIKFKVVGDFAELEFDIKPRAIGCLLQK
ncbi:MAG: DUF6259 domain-containing protein [Verrucomicrobiia bacterium]